MRPCLKHLGCSLLHCPVEIFNNPISVSCLLASSCPEYNLYPLVRPVFPWSCFQASHKCSGPKTLAISYISVGLNLDLFLWYLCWLWVTVRCPPVSLSHEVLFSCNTWNYIFKNTISLSQGKDSVHLIHAESSAHCLHSQLPMIPCLLIE